MTTRAGRPPLATAAQRRRVYQLTSAGWSSRAIAARVFGDAGLKNRVLRLLERRRRRYRELGLDSMTVDELDDYTRKLIDQLGG